MEKETIAFNKNKIYLSFNEYVNMFNFLSKIVSLKTLAYSGNINKPFYNIPNGLRRIDCTDMLYNVKDNNIDYAKSYINHAYHCNVEFDSLYRDYINTELLLSVILCNPAKQDESHINYIHPFTIIDKPLFADDHDHIYLFIDKRLCSDDNFIKDINKFNDEEEIFSQEYNQSQYPIISRADYFNKMLDKIMEEVCRKCEPYVLDNIRLYNAALSYTLYNDGSRFKGDKKKKLNELIDAILSEAVSQDSNQYLSICFPAILKDLFDLNLKIYKKYN